MDALRFDRWTKAFVTTPSRRTVVRALAGGVLTAALGHVVPSRAGADVSINDFDLTCRQTGVTFYCVDPLPNTECGPNRLGCQCALTRKNDKPRCVEQPKGGCPKKSERCKQHNDCDGNEVCIKVPDCCPNHPNRGKCVKPCKS
jgi:hypothetical protein